MQSSQQQRTRPLCLPHSSCQLRISLPRRKLRRQLPPPRRLSVRLLKLPRPAHRLSVRLGLRLPCPARCLSVRLRTRLPCPARCLSLRLGIRLPRPARCLSVTRCHRRPKLQPASHPVYRSSCKSCKHVQGMHRQRTHWLLSWLRPFWTNRRHPPIHQAYRHRPRAQPLRLRRLRRQRRANRLCPLWRLHLLQELCLHHRTLVTQHWQEVLFLHCPRLQEAPFLKRVVCLLRPHPPLQPLLRHCLMGVLPLLPRLRSQGRLPRRPRRPLLHRHPRHRRRARPHLRTRCVRSTPRLILLLGKRLRVFVKANRGPRNFADSGRASSD